LEIGGFWFELLVFSMLFFLFQAPISKVGFQVANLVHQIVDFAIRPSLQFFYFFIVNQFSFANNRKSFANALGSFPNHLGSTLVVSSF
jgi:hypothetical protein